MDGFPLPCMKMQWTSEISVQKTKCRRGQKMRTGFQGRFIRGEAVTVERLEGGVFPTATEQEEYPRDPVSVEGEVLPDEKWLFHGTNALRTDHICRCFYQQVVHAGVVDQRGIALDIVDGAPAPIPSATPLTMRSIRSGMESRTREFWLRHVPSISQVSATTL